MFCELPTTTSTSSFCEANQAAGDVINRLPCHTANMLMPRVRSAHYDNG
jgi:hypothetical protein